MVVSASARRHEPPPAEPISRLAEPPKAHTSMSEDSKRAFEAARAKEAQTTEKLGYNPYESISSTSSGAIAAPTGSGGASGGGASGGDASGSVGRGLEGTPSPLPLPPLTFPWGRQWLPPLAPSGRISG